MNLGIIGSGMIVQDFLTIADLIDDMKLEAILGRKESIEKINFLANKYNINKTYYDYDELLDDDNIDTVYIAVPNHLHFEFTKKALNHKKHVICEKPFTSHIEELEELNAVAKEEHLLLLEAISTQYLPNVLKMKELLSEVGNVKIVSANYSQYSSRYNAFKEGKILPAFDVTKSGGALMDLNIYNIHLLVALFGEPLHVEYQANIEKGIDTSGIITLDYGTFKAVLIGAKDCKAPIMTSIQGDQGCLVLDTPANNASRFKLLKNDKSEYDYDEQHGQHRMYYEFVESVKIFEQKDYDRAQEMMQKSLIAMKIATLARKSAGVEFPADKR